MTFISTYCEVQHLVIGNRGQYRNPIEDPLVRCETTYLAATYSCCMIPMRAKPQAGSAHRPIERRVDSMAGPGPMPPCLKTVLLNR